MTREPKDQGTRKEYVKKNTMLLISFICLAVGFFGGVVYTAYKSGSAVQVPGLIPQQAQQEGTQEKSATEDQAGEMLALEKEVGNNPANAGAWLRLGNLYFDTNNYQNAIRAYKKFLALKPNNADVQTDLGVMYRRSGKPREALKAFQAAVKIDPEHEIARFNMGIVMLHDLNDRKGALRAWEDLIHLNPSAKAPDGQPLKEYIKRLKELPNS
ncbi:MAG: tetratricopeptide repeat protein [Desulfatiglandaceae bacterium]|jgi:cytochrome c-type biogenesis protein CcmH/NrfG